MMKPVKLISLVKSLFPEATVTIPLSDPLVEGSSHLVCFSAYGTGVCIDCSDDGYSIYDNVGDDELHLNFKDYLHVLPFIHHCLDSGKAEPELPQYDDFCRHLTAVYHQLVAEVSFEYSGVPERSDGYLRFWFESFLGWRECLEFPELYQHGCIFISVVTGDIFQVFGGTEYAGASSFKLVSCHPHKLVGDYVDADGGYSL